MNGVLRWLWFALVSWALYRAVCGAAILSRAMATDVANVSGVPGLLLPMYVLFFAASCRVLYRMAAENFPERRTQKEPFKPKDKKKMRV